LAKPRIRITHRESGIVLAEDPLGWSITPFEGNYYISKRCLRASGFKPNWIPGICPYKFFYVWLDLNLGGGFEERSIAWMYWLPNPLFPFIGSGWRCPARILHWKLKRTREGIELREVAAKLSGLAAPLYNAETNPLQIGRCSSQLMRSMFS
jgi:hypothetical protein